MQAEWLNNWLLGHIGSDYPRRHFILAVSGGLDSVALCHSFSALLPATALTIAHFDHRMRDAAKGERQFVRMLAHQMNIGFVEGQRQGSVVSENALREERWAFLQEVRRALGAHFVVTGHHANDQLETQLMRMIRGTGLTGIRAMQPRSGCVLRPFLCFPKSELQELALNNGWGFREDFSNTDDRFFRNRVRKELIPPLEKLSESFGGKGAFYQRLQGTWAELAWAAQFVDESQRKLFATHCVVTPYWIRSKVSDYLALPFPERALLLRAVREKLDSVPLNRDELARLDREISEGTREFWLSEKLRVIQSCGQVYFQNALQREAPLPLFEKQDNDTVSTQLGFRAKSLKEGEFLWRTFQAGDRVGSKKLKEVFLERGVPQPERSLLPVLTRAGSQEVVWFPRLDQVGPTKVELSFPFSHLAH